MLAIEFDKLVRGNKGAQKGLKKGSKRAPKNTQICTFNTGFSSGKATSGNPVECAISYDNPRSRLEAWQAESEILLSARLISHNSVLL